MATAVNYTVTGRIEGSSRVVNGFGRNPKADGSDEDGPPLNPPHPRLTGLGKCHKFPYHCVCSRRNFRMPASVAVKQQLGQITGGSCSGGAKNCYRLDQQASRDDVNISNNLRNEIPSLIPASSGQNIADITLHGFLEHSNFNSESNSCIVDHETKRSSGLTTSTNLKTGDNSHEQGQLNDSEKEVVQSGSSVTTGGVEQRSVSAEDLTEAHRRQAHKTIHQNNTFLTSSSSLHSSYPSSSHPASSSTPLQIQHNQHSFEQQILDNSQERVSLDSVAEKGTISSCQENSGCEISSAKSNHSEVSTPLFLPVAQTSSPTLVLTYLFLNQPETTQYRYLRKQIPDVFICASFAGELGVSSW